MDTRAPQDWLLSNIAYDNQNPEVAMIKTKKRAVAEKSALALWKDKDGLSYWRKIQVKRYLKNSEKYEGFWLNTNEKIRLSRILILFEDEDPREFAARYK